MIITVKVRPRSEWCEGAKRNIPRPDLIGDSVEIETNTYSTIPLRDCDEVNWEVRGITAQKGREEVHPLIGLCICRHVLEID